MTLKAIDLEMEIDCVTNRTEKYTRSLLKMLWRRRCPSLHFRVNEPIDRLILKQNDIKKWSSGSIDVLVTRFGSPQVVKVPWS